MKKLKSGGFLGQTNFSTKSAIFNTAYDLFFSQAMTSIYKGFYQIPTNQQASTTIYCFLKKRL